MFVANLSTPLSSPIPTVLRPGCVCYSYTTGCYRPGPIGAMSERTAMFLPSNKHAILSRPGVVGKTCGASWGRARRAVNRSSRRTVGTPGLRRKKRRCQLVTKFGRCALNSLAGHSVLDEHGDPRKLNCRQRIVTSNPESTDGRPAEARRTVKYP